MKFSQPQYIQGADKKPVYVFNVNSETPFIHSNEEQPNIENVLAEGDGKQYVINLYSEFATSCSKFFPRPLTVERIAARTSHVIKTIQDDEMDNGFIVWHMSPLSVCVSGTQINIYWMLTKTCSVIDFDDEEDKDEHAPVEVPLVQLPMTSLSLNDSSPAITKLKDELVALDDIPVCTASENTFVLKSPASSTASKGKVTKKLREARLQVKLAKFRAARAYEKYVNKYGDDLSESETDTEGATTDYTTDNGSETSDSSH
jgi:hypothetical protein